ncbi:DNA-binding protein [Streptomyces antimycoticus]|uniref:DNA-binding protein n=1 Tax=Streptomyces antimycoticus TaxID=68175 RepID=UPI003863C87F|nr:DNA-binding protein [Streptomyces antimycoticus]
MAEALTWGEVLALPATTDLVTGARAFGLGRTVAYELARAGNFPCRLIRAGATYRVITADLLRTLQIDPRISGDAGPCTSDAANGTPSPVTSDH